MATNKYSDSFFNFSLWIPNKLFDQSRVSVRRSHRHDAAEELHLRIAYSQLDASNIPLSRARSGSGGMHINAG